MGRLVSVFFCSFPTHVDLSCFPAHNQCPVSIRTGQITLEWDLKAEAAGEVAAEAVSPDETTCKPPLNTEKARQAIIETRVMEWCLTSMKGGARKENATGAEVVNENENEIDDEVKTDLDHLLEESGDVPVIETGTRSIGGSFLEFPRMNSLH
jgi:hypothetical protein